MKYKKYGIIVLGGHVQALGIARIAGQNKIPLIAIDDKNINLIRFSKYCTKFYRKRNKKVISFLTSFISNEKYQNWLIIPTNDSHLEILSQNLNLLKPYFNVLAEPSETIKFFYNKIETYKLCDSLKIPYPKSIFPKSFEDLKHKQLNFPVIIKPAIMHKFFSKTRKKVYICNNQSELLENYLLAKTIVPQNEIIVQEVIKGSSENQYSACFSFNKSMPLVTLLARRKRQHPIDFGNATTFAESIPYDADLINQSINLLKSVKYFGFAEVEYKRDNSGKIYLLEVNPRLWKWHLIGMKSRSPFIMSIYNNIFNFKGDTQTNTWCEASFRHTITDFYVLFKIFIKKRKVISLNNQNCQNAVWDIKDPLPGLMEILFLPYFIFTRT